MNIKTQVTPVRRLPEKGISMVLFYFRYKGIIILVKV